MAAAGEVPIPEEDADLGVSPGPSPQHRRSDEEEYADFQRWLRERRRGSRRAQRHDDDEEDGDDQSRTNAGPPPA